MLFVKPNASQRSPWSARRSYRTDIILTSSMTSVLMPPGLSATVCYPTRQDQFTSASNLNPQRDSPPDRQVCFNEQWLFRFKLDFPFREPVSSEVHANLSMEAGRYRLLSELVVEGFNEPELISRTWLLGVDEGEDQSRWPFTADLLVN